MNGTILLVSAEYPPARGGVGDYTRELAAGLGRAGLHAEVLTSVRERDGTADPDAWPVSASVADWGTATWGAVALAARRTGAGIVHVQYQTAAYGMHPAINLLPWRLRAAGLGVPVVTTFHDLRPPYLFPKAGSARHLAALALAAGSKAVIVVTREHWWEPPLAWLRRLDRRLAEKTYVVPIGSNIPVTPPAGYEREAWRERLGIGPTETLLAYFGFINRTKGVEDLLRALATLRRAGEPVRLIMIGGEGQSNAGDAGWRAEIDALVPALGLQEAVLRTGYGSAEDVSGHLLAADLCVLPFRDGATFQRGTLMAAFAHGMPVLSTLPRAPELVTGGALPHGWDDAATSLRHGENAWLVPAASPPALAEAVRRLVAEPGLRRRLAVGAHALAQAVGWDTIAHRHRCIYEALLVGRGRTSR